MNPEQWTSVKELCVAALARNSAERAAYLENICRDESLLSEVRSLLLFESIAQQNFNELSQEFVAAALLQNGSLSGCRIGNYLIYDLLGRGGMGEVYLAEDTDLGRKVALKVLAREFTENEQPLQRFKQEARAASGLKHRNIITIYSVGQDSGIYFIATEYVPGSTLRQRLTASGPLELEAAINIAMQIASALESAHRAGIVHRDVKPENIMFEHDGTAKLLDFGIAKLTENLTAETSTGTGPLKTEQDVILGTPAYMSPEQARHQPLDHRSDLFSLGVVLYEMIAGKVPFSGSTPYDQQAAVLVTEPTPVRQQLAKLVPELQWVISKVLTKDPDRRYQSATDLLIDLQLLNQRLELEKEAHEQPDIPEQATTSSKARSTPHIELQVFNKHWWRPRLRQPKVLAIGVIAILFLTAAFLWLTAPQRLAAFFGLLSPRPVIESIVPGRPVDIIGNQPIEVHGRHFQDGLRMRVEFPNGGSNELSGAQIQKQQGETASFSILIDFNGNPGNYAFQLLNPDGQVSPKFVFEARHETQRPSITWIEPANVRKSSGEQLVAVYGSNFQIGVKVEVIQPNGETSELKDRQIANRTPNSFHGLFFFHLPGKHSIRAVNPNGGKSEYFDILVQ